MNLYIKICKKKKMIEYILIKLQREYRYVHFTKLESVFKDDIFL